MNRANDKVNNTEKNKANEKIKALALIALGIVSLLHTQNNPVTILERFFMPIKVGSGTFFYAGILSIVILFKGVKLLASSMGKRTKGNGIYIFLVAIGIIILTTTLCDDGIRYKKSTSLGLTSIRCNYEKQYLQIEELSDNKLEVKVNLELENLGEKKKDFSIKIDMPNSLKTAKKIDSIYIKNADDQMKNYSIRPGEVKKIEEVFVVEKNLLSTNERDWYLDYTFYLMSDNESIKYGKEYFWK